MTTESTGITIQQLVARIQQDARDNPKHVLKSIAWFREHGENGFPDRYKFEVNFTEALDSHWLNVLNHSRIRLTNELTQHNPAGNRPSLETLESIIDRLVIVLGDDKIQREFFDQIMFLRETSKDFANRPWSKLYLNMRANRLTLMQMAVTQVIWHRASFEFEQAKSQLTREDEKLMMLQTLDPLGISTRLNQLNKERKEVLKKLQPVKTQLSKYQSIEMELSGNLEVIDNEFEELAKRMEKLTDAQRESTVEQAFKQSGRQPEIVLNLKRIKMDLSGFDI